LAPCRSPLRRSLPVSSGGWSLRIVPLALLSTLIASAASGEPIASGVPSDRLSCTSFAVTDGTRAFLGDSEDAGMSHPLWADPAGGYAFFRAASPTDYGRVHLGWLWQREHPSFQAGMNDRGLAYALTAVPETSMHPHTERPFVHGRDGLFDWILRRAATVEEAIEATLQFSFTSCGFQIQFADAVGRSAVVSPTSDGEFSITHRRPASTTLVASTFNAAEPDRALGRDSYRRHAQATEALSEFAEGAPTRELPIKALAAVGRRGPYALNRSYTVYSTIYDLTRLRVTVFLLSLYDAPVTIDLRDALQQGDHRIELRAALPEDRVRAAIRTYWLIQASGFAAIVIPIAAVLTGLGFAVRSFVRHRRGARHA